MSKTPTNAEVNHAVGHLDDAVMLIKKARELLQTTGQADSLQEVMLDLNCIAWNHAKHIYGLE
jgi:hypothetical protein